MSTLKISRHSSVKVFSAALLKKMKHFFGIDIQFGKSSKLCENTSLCGLRVSTQILVFMISTRVDITVYQNGKRFIFLKYKLKNTKNLTLNEKRNLHCKN